MPREAHRHSCVGAGFIVLDVIRSSIGSRATERRFAGGSCGNVLSILAYFGWESIAVGRIGDDHAGRELVADLRRWSVVTRLLQAEPGRGTPIVVQENYLDHRGRPRHRFTRACPVCGATLPAYRPLRMSEAESISTKLPLHSVFYYDRVTPGTLELARGSRAKGALVVFEPSGIKDDRLFVECLRSAHVVKYAHDRLDGIHDVVMKAKVPAEIVTLGAKGLRLRVRSDSRAGAWQELPAFSPPELRDAAGSGDWTTAGMIHALMCSSVPVDDLVTRDDAVAGAVRYGQALAAINCGFEGARGVMYAADAEVVLDLAGAIAKGTKEPSVVSVKPSYRTDRRGNDKACLTCRGARALHA
jgi:fructokinase